MEKKPYYEMITEAGETACQRLVDRITTKIMGLSRFTASDILEQIETGRKLISVKHGEVFDTEPRVHIADQVNKALRAAGYSFYFDDFMNPTDGQFK